MVSHAHGGRPLGRILGFWVAKVPGAPGAIRSIKHSGLKQVLGFQMAERWRADDAQMAVARAEVKRKVGPIQSIKHRVL